MRFLRVIGCLNMFLIVLFLLLKFYPEISIPIATCFAEKASDIEDSFLVDMIHYASLHNKYANYAYFKKSDRLAYYLDFFKLKKFRKDFLYEGEYCEHIGGIRVYDTERNLIWDFYFLNSVSFAKIGLFPYQLRQSLLEEFIKTRKISGVFVYSENGFKELFCKTLSGESGAVFGLWVYNTFGRYKLVSPYLLLQWPFKGFPDVGRHAVELNWEKLAKKYRLSFPFKQFVLFRVYQFGAIMFNWPEDILTVLVLFQIVLLFFIFLKGKVNK